MKKLPDVCQIDAFTKEPFRGNYAGVIYADGLTSVEMQLIAREFNVAETAFLSKSDKADYHLRWFSPEVEIKLCGHATIASVHYLSERGILKDNSSVSFNTLSGILNCRNENGLYYLDLPVPKVEKFTGNKDEIIKALGATLNSINKEHPFILADGNYLYIHFKSLKDVEQLKPDYRTLKNISITKHEFEAVTVFTTETYDKESTAHLRFFAPFFGIDEDPVTGSANGPMLLVLRELGLVDKNTEGKIFTFEQGDIIGRKGRVKVSYSPSKNVLTIAGNAVTVFKGELNF